MEILSLYKKSRSGTRVSSIFLQKMPIQIIRSGIGIFIMDPRNTELLAEKIKFYLEHWNEKALFSVPKTDIDPRNNSFEAKKILAQENQKN